MTKTDKIKIILLYFFLFAGGLWHVMDVFQTLMSFLSAPLLICLGIWLYYEIRKNLEPKRDNKFNFWTLAVIVFSFAIETIGIKTGIVFGEYNYGNTLWPQLFGVPIAIGFAWFLMLICSIALMQRLPVINTSNIRIKILAASILMTFFDFIMEPAAIKLNYWSWLTTTIPLQNYLAWFVISFILMILGWRLRVLDTKMPSLVMHGYFAQLIYFILIIFK